jgi:hypothetical protein
MSISLHELEALKKYAATSAQLTYIHTLQKHGGNSAKAARDLGLGRDTVAKAMRRLRRSAAKRGYSPEHDMVHDTPEGFQVTGVSTLYNSETGEPKVQWVKTVQEKEKLLEIALEHVKEVFSDKKYKISKIAAPTKKLDKDLLIAYPMGDPHIGMFSWGKETGDDFDLEIAENNLVEATRRLVECGPNAETGIIINVGDFYHSDNQSNKTTRSGNSLDVDNRWAKVLRVGVRAMRSCIELALKKHKTVYVINEIGNHDDHTAQVLTLALSMAYENNPRIHFDTSPAKYHYHKFGEVLIGVTHGDTVKPEKLGELMATDRAQDWGTTKFRYWYTGHIHTRKVFELPGCVVESFRTLAAKDAWTAGAGYRSGRDMYAVVLHKQFGEIERHRVDVAMLE